MKRIINTILAVIFIGIITVCADLIIEKLVGRTQVDLTEERLYTLSEGTLSIISKTQPVELTLYYASSAARKGPGGIRFYNNYFHYIHDVLSEYCERSGGKITLSVVDPRQWSDEEADAMEAGVQRIPLSNGEPFFFGLVAKNELGKKKVIPFFPIERQETVEYDISHLLDQLSRKDRNTIGVLSSLQVMGTPPYIQQMLEKQGRMDQIQQAWIFIQRLKQQYNVIPIEASVKEISDIDLLLVIQPTTFDERTLFAIDQYVMNGGKVMCLIDPFMVADNQRQQDNNSFYKLLSAWGVTMDPSAIVIDRTLAQKASTGNDIKTILPFLKLTKENMNQQDSFVSSVNNANVIFSGNLTINESAGTTVSPLMKTSAMGNTWMPTQDELYQFNPDKVNRTCRDGKEPLILAARISGQFKSAFPDGITLPPAENEASTSTEATPSDEPQKVSGMVESTRDPMVIVIADADLISNYPGFAYKQSFFGFTPSNDNEALVFNLLDSLSGSSDLVGIRSRGQYQRPFILIDQIEKEAEKNIGKQVEEINTKIKDAQNRLSDFASTAGKDVNKIQSKALEEQVKLRRDLKSYNKELRDLKSTSREVIEAKGRKLMYLNMFAAPVVVLIIAIGLYLIRIMRARRYAARRYQ